MTDHEHIERQLHDAAAGVRVGTAVSSEVRLRINLRRVGTVSAGMVMVAALVFGATFAAGAFSTGGTKIGPANDSPGDGNYALGPQVTIAEGNFLGVDWEYYGYESNDGLCLELAIGNNSGGGCGFQGRKTGEPVVLTGTSFGASPDGTGIAAVEGRVSDAVRRLEIEIDDHDGEKIDLVQAPDELGLKDRVFVHLIDANRLSRNPDARLVAYGSDDKVLARERVTGLEDFAPQDSSDNGSPADFAAIWPEDAREKADAACDRAMEGGAANNIRYDPESIALEFGALVLGWEEPGVAEVGGAEANRFEGVVLELADGRPGRDRAVYVWTTEVSEGCWSVRSVSRVPDQEPTGVSVSVRGREVQIGFDTLDATDGTVEVGYGGRVETKRWVAAEARERPVTFQLDFDPNTTGHFLILFEDQEGDVFSASGGPLPAGDFSAG